VKAGTSPLLALHESFVGVTWSRILKLKQTSASFVVFKKNAEDLVQYVVRRWAALGKETWICLPTIHVVSLPSAALSSSPVFMHLCGLAKAFRLQIIISIRNCE